MAQRESDIFMMEIARRLRSCKPAARRVEIIRIKNEIVQRKGILFMTKDSELARLDAFNSMFPDQMLDRDSFVHHLISCEDTKQVKADKYEAMPEDCADWGTIAINSGTTAAVIAATI